MYIYIYIGGDDYVVDIEGFREKDLDPGGDQL